MMIKLSDAKTNYSIFHEEISVFTISSKVYATMITILLLTKSDHFRRVVRIDLKKKKKTDVTMS